MKTIKIINIRENPDWVERAADYYSSRWNIDRQLYLDSLTDSISTKELVPRWFLMLRGSEIIGGCGLIENDFMVRTDLCPWLCALYIEPSERGKGLGAQLLMHCRRVAAGLGYNRVYLNTDHVGYYEKYDWHYLGDFAHQSGNNTRVYDVDTLPDLEEMSAFFNTRADSYDSHMLDDCGLGDFYAAISDCFDKPVKRLLDLGCGTGLEFDRLFERFPNMDVTGIDISEDMLKILADKFLNKKLRLICGSYFDVDFGSTYDYVLSTYSLHHFTEERKLGLYKKIFAALEPEGIFIFGDYTVLTMEQQQELLVQNEWLRREQGIAEDEFYHFDTPFTPETEIRLLKEAGFKSIEIARQWERTSIIISKK